MSLWQLYPSEEDGDELVVLGETPENLVPCADESTNWQGTEGHVMGRERVLGSGKRWWWALLVVALLGSGCALPPGNPREVFTLRFDITYEGERLKGWNGGDDELVFSASPDDFYPWSRWMEFPTAVDGKAPILTIVPNYQEAIEPELRDRLDRDGDRLCLTEAMVFFDSETLEQVYEIPVGTCLENGGTTVIVID